jgi:hypothetical protein
VEAQDIVIVGAGSADLATAALLRQLASIRSCSRRAPTLAEPVRPVTAAHVRTPRKSSVARPRHPGTADQHGDQARAAALRRPDLEDPAEALDPGPRGARTAAPRSRASAPRSSRPARRRSSTWASSTPCAEDAWRSSRQSKDSRALTSCSQTARWSSPTRSGVRAVRVADDERPVLLEVARKLEYLPSGNFAKLQHELSIGE